ncbi:MAG TPA: dihydrolipoamide acetyltransferase family protein, partial [Ktedonobacterales bacterium]|nr:dihydrolipoamide acetyltransferase family protein [Ktedonobacterales bacterium]
MATNVILPALGMAQDTGKIIEWRKAEGERVTQGEPLVVIETDKAAVDLEAPASGILAQVSAAAGDEVPVARVIAVILSPEEATRVHSVPAQPVPAAAATPADGAAAAPTPASGARTGSSQEAHAPARNGRRAASPKARRIAAEHGVDIMAVRGTGPSGVVLAADVFAAQARAAAAATAAPAQASPVATIAVTAPRGAGDARDSSQSTTWRLMAERTTQSWTSVPHFFLLREVSAAQLMAWRERAIRRVLDGVTYTDLLVKIVAEALRRHPRLNATWANGTIAANEQINIGLAVATEHGLAVPVLHQADDLSLRGIARQRADLVARAQAGRLQLRDLQDGTFTISNLGMYGVDAFNAIVNPPQAAILAVGRIADRV